MIELDEIDWLAFEDAGKELTDSKQWFRWRKNTNKKEDRHWLFACDGISFDNAKLCEDKK